MSWLNYEDVAEQLSSAGLIVDPQRGLEINTPVVVRCKADGIRGRPGWYRLYSISLPSGDGLIVGSFGVNQGAEHNTQKIILRREDRPRLTQEQFEAIRSRQIADRQASEAEQRRKWALAADRSSAWWRQCVDHGENRYLIRKGLPAGRLYGARLSPSGNLVIPIQDANGRIWGLQVVYHDSEIVKRKGRDKDFCPAGLAKKANFFCLGSPMAGRLALLCEGFATGASLHEATGLPVVIAFDAGNLLPVAQAVVKKYRGLRLLVCADDDYDWQEVGKKNAGIESGKAAALAVGGGCVWPIFPGERPLKTHKGPTDFNDLHTHPDGGLSMVARQIETSITALGWGAATKPVIRAPECRQGDGEKRTPMRGLYTLDEACERWTLLYGADGAFFDSFEHLIVKKTDVLALIPDHAARDWKLRPDRKVARFQEVGFDPTETDPRVVCNLWGGWPTAPKAGDCDILLELLRWMCSLESNSREAYEWALRWLAFPIQHHGAKMKTTLIFHGLQGAGKNVFFDAIAAIYGEYGGTVDQLAVESQFNDWASRKLFLIFDEVVARNELYFLKNRIKSLITGDTIRINPKNLTAWNERNHCNGVWLSNELHPAAVELSDRRHFIIWTPPALTTAFYLEVAACLRNGGREALHHYLLHLDLGDFDEHSKPPMTDAKAAVQELSSGSIERFCRDWLAGETAYPICACGSGQLYRAYARWCVAAGEKPRSQNNLSGYAGKQPGWAIAHKDVFETALYSGTPKRTRLLIPPDSALRPRPGQDYRKRPDKTEAQWATDCFFTFRDALGGNE